VPADYASGGSFRVRANAVETVGPTVESLSCTGSFNSGAPPTAGSVAIGAAADYVCAPAFGAFTAGGILTFHFWISAPAAMDNAVRLLAASFEYTATQ
jgi:hypothetical protein